MHMTIHWLLMAALALLAFPVAVLLVQTALACLPRRAQPPRQYASTRPSVAVLVPAHNEEAGIGPTVASLKAQLGPQDRILVVADNCTDQTAQQAQLAGAEVCIRNDPLLRGKSYALDYGMRALAADPPQVVIIVDADCEASPGSLDTLARETASAGRPVQALYLMESPHRERPGQRLAEFAWRVKNQVRPSGYARMGLPCQLMGTGMAFPWAILSRAALASGHLAEDLKLGLDLARAGSAPQFCPQACVVSRFAASDAGTRTQRTRWEHGHLALLWHELPRCLFTAVREWNGPLLALALDLLVPPLALLALAVGAALLLTAGYAFIAGAWLSLVFAAALNAALLLAILLAWRKAGRDLISARDLLYAFGYALRKVPLYLRFFGRRQAQWVRTERE